MRTRSTASCCENRRLVSGSRALIQLQFPRCVLTFESKSIVIFNFSTRRIFPRPFRRRTQPAECESTDARRCPRLTATIRLCFWRAYQRICCRGFVRNQADFGDDADRSWVPRIVEGGIEKCSREVFCAESALCLRSVSVRTIDFGGLTCHRWPCMLLNVRCTVFSNPTLSAILFKTNKPGITCSTPTVPSPTLQECSRKPPEAVRKPSIRRPAEYTAWSESSRLGSPERFPHGQLE